MNEKDLSDQLKDAPDAVQNCAQVDRVFYERGGCTLGTDFKCPYQTRRYMASVDGTKLPGCVRYSNTLRIKFGLPLNNF